MYVRTLSNSSCWPCMHGQSVSPPAPTFTVASSLQSPSPASRPTLLLLCCAAAFEQRTAEAVSAGVFLSTSRCHSWAAASSPETDQTDRHTLTPSVYSFTRLTPLPAVSCSRAGGRRLFSFFFFSLSLSISPCPSLWTLAKKVQVRTSIYHVELVLVSRPPLLSPPHSLQHSQWPTLRGVLRSSSGQREPFSFTSR